MSNPSELLSKLFDAERSVRHVHVELLQQASHRANAGDELVNALAAATDEALGHPDKDETTLRIVRIAELLSELPGPKVIDVLVKILGCDEPEGRHTAGEALEGLAFERFKEVALGVERALEALPVGNPALSELPYLLAEVPEPGVMKLLGKFLKHKDQEAVAAAIDALVEVGDPSGVGMLTPLLEDRREVQLEDDVGDEGKITVGELATEARDFLTDLLDGRGKAAR